MLTIDEAIKHCEEVAEEQEEITIYTPIEMLNSDVDIEKCQECANEHRQLAEWLRELKAYRNIRRILSQNRVVTEIAPNRYGEVVMWDDIKRAFEEVSADENIHS